MHHLRIRATVIAKANTTQRGYGYPHQQARAAAKPSVDAGHAYCAELICLMPDRWIRPGTYWDMAHDRTHPGHYLGPAHRRCNRAEGARHRDLAKRTRITRRWRSRIW